MGDGVPENCADHNHCKTAPHSDVASADMEISGHGDNGQEACGSDGQWKEICICCVAIVEDRCVGEGWPSQDRERCRCNNYGHEQQAHDVCSDHVTAGGGLPDDVGEKDCTYRRAAPKIPCGQPTRGRRILLLPLG